MTDEGIGGGGSFGGAGATARWEIPTTDRVLNITRDPMTPETAAFAPPPTLGVVKATGLIQPLYSLEQPWRSNRKGVSCVPEGMYRLVLVRSARFRRDLPRLLNVPGREGILFHGGNSTADTEGCILVGRERAMDGRSIIRSQEALGYLIFWLRLTTAAGDVWCRITRAAAAPTA